MYKPYAQSLKWNKKNQTLYNPKSIFVAISRKNHSEIINYNDEMIIDIRLSRCFDTNLILLPKIKANAYMHDNSVTIMYVCVFQNETSIATIINSNRRAFNYTQMILSMCV